MFLFLADDDLYEKNMHLPISMRSPYSLAYRKKTSSLTTSPLGCASRKSPLTPYLYSPMRNLRLSESTSPVPPSPSRKRQNTFREQIFSSSCDLPDEMSDQSDDVESQSSSYHPKHGRYTCKSETHAAKKPGCEEKSNFLFEVQQSVQNQIAAKFRTSSSSLPCSPSHVMPAKWRFKQRQREGKDDRSMTPTSASHEISAKLHSKSSSYGDTLFVSQSQINDVQAYQSQDQLIVITDDLAPDNEETMEVEENITSSNPSEQRQFKRFQTPSDEVRDINEVSCSSDDSVMLPDPTNNAKPSNPTLIPDPDAALMARKAHETGSSNCYNFIMSY